MANLFDTGASLISSLIIFLITIVSAQIILALIDKFVKKTKLGIDPTHYNFFMHFLRAVIYVFGLAIAVYNIPQLRALSVSILAGAGVLTVILGFASQQAFSNIVSGVFIALFKPIRVGDRIKIGLEVAGVVEDINLRHTLIKTFENKRIIIPNSVLSEQVIENSNLGEDKVCKFIEFGVSYDSDLDQAVKIMRQETEKHPNNVDNRTKQEKERGEPKVQVRVIGFGESSVNLRAYAWAADPKSGTIMSWDLNKRIKDRFDEEGIEIPFPHRTIVYKKTDENTHPKKGNRSLP
ncbi:MAG: mechanosensitive ion channel [Candidatus Altiarchaeales archaeon]|nr:mechanosensitive ion channel [Candidatus Altiarchaeales archaeon]